MTYMKRIIPLLLLGIINISNANAQEERGVVYSLEDFRAMALGQSKTILISKEKVKMAEEMKKATFPKFFCKRHVYVESEEYFAFERRCLTTYRYKGG